MSDNPPQPEPANQRLPISRIGVRELRNNVAAVLRRAGQGDRILVTVDGHPSAQLGPLTPDPSGFTLWDLAGAGLIEPPHSSAGERARPEPIPVPIDFRADRLLELVRGQ